MAWSKEYLEQFRLARSLYLGWIAAIQRGEPITRQTEDGQVLETANDDLARYQENVAELEHYLTDAGEPLDA